MRVLSELAKPRVLALMCLLTLAGATLSPAFLAPDFPPTPLGRRWPFLWLGLRYPELFQPVMWSLAHALGAAVVVGLLWVGVALVNDLSDGVIDRLSNPGRPLVSERVRRGTVTIWAVGSLVIALGLVAVEGSDLALWAVVAAIALGLAYSLPPLRLRTNGVVANAIIGLGVGGALLGGMMAQGTIPAQGLVSAGSLGWLAAAASMVKDFKDVDGDRAGGVRTLPVVLGLRRAVLVNLAVVGVGYLPLFATVGSWLAGAMVAAALAANLVLLSRLLRDPGAARVAYRQAILLFMGVTVLYVGAQVVG